MSFQINTSAITNRKRTNVNVFLFYLASMWFFSRCSFLLSLLVLEIWERRIKTDRFQRNVNDHHKKKIYFSDSLFFVIKCKERARHHTNRKKNNTKKTHGFNLYWESNKHLVKPIYWYVRAWRDQLQRQDLHPSHFDDHLWHKQDIGKCSKKYRNSFLFSFVCSFILPEVLIYVIRLE